jgi:hypothetical protein
MALYKRPLKKKGPRWKTKGSKQYRTKESVTLYMDFGGLDDEFIPQTKEDSEWPRFGRSTIMIACFKLVAIAYRKGLLSTQYKNEIGFTKGLLEALKKVTPQDIEKATLEAVKREIED